MPRQAKYLALGMLISAILFLPECFAPNYTLTTETELELVFHEQVPLVLLKVHWWNKHAYCKAWCGCLFRCYTTESQKKYKTEYPKRSVGKGDCL